MMRRIKISIALALTLVFAGCKDYLDMVPEKDIETIESIFEIRRSAMSFYNSCFYGVVDQLSYGQFKYDPGMILGGEYAANEYLRTDADSHFSFHSYLGDVLGISDGFQNTSLPYSSLWKMGERGMTIPSVYSCIRYCNIFIENIDKVNNMQPWEKSAWKAEIKCLKALYYFELMKRYGPIALVPHNIPVDTELQEMQLPRSPVDECFAEIVRLFDEAIPDLRPRVQMPISERASFSVEAAYAFKAKVLLYAASPLFNGNEWYADFKNRDGVQLFNTTYDPEKWKLAGEAADKAIEIAEAAGMKLIEGSQQEKTAKLNHITDIQNCVMIPNWDEDEWLFAQKRSKTNNGQDVTIWLPRFSQQNYWHSLWSWGSLVPHIGTVEMFYTENGLPIDKDRTWPYANRYRPAREVNAEYVDIINMDRDVINLHLRREPRFYANIAADGTYWEIVNTLVEVEPYKGNGILGTDYDRFNDPTQPQNITGYWAKKYWTGDDDPAYNIYNRRQRPFVVLRLADLYLIQAEAWNEYSGPSEKVYGAIDKVRDRAGILPIRQAWSSYAITPAEVLNKDGLREAIHRERMIELVFEGQRAWDLRRWKKAHLYLNEPKFGWNVMGENAATFYNNYEGPRVVDNKAKFISPRDYFWPLKSEEIMIANIVQNPGW